MDSNKLVMDLMARLADAGVKPASPTISKHDIKRVIFNNPATVVFWGDGTKTVVKCSGGDVFNPEMGLALAICKKAFGNTGAYNDVFKRWVPTNMLLDKRKALVEFCRTKSCNGCPLGNKICGRGYYFDISIGRNGYMTDGAIEDAYKCMMEWRKHHE